MCSVLELFLKQIRFNFFFFTWTQAHSLLNPLTEALNPILTTLSKKCIVLLSPSSLADSHLSLCRLYHRLLPHRRGPTVSVALASRSHQDLSLLSLILASQSRIVLSLADSQTLSLDPEVNELHLPTHSNTRLWSLICSPMTPMISADDDSLLQSVFIAGFVVNYKDFTDSHSTISVEK